LSGIYHRAQDGHGLEGEGTKTCKQCYADDQYKEEGYYELQNVRMLPLMLVAASANDTTSARDNTQSTVS
jgi:hypothetical protein